MERNCVMLKLQGSAKQVRQEPITFSHLVSRVSAKTQSHPREPGVLQQDLSVMVQWSCGYILPFKNAMAGDFGWEEIVRTRSKEQL